MSFLHFWPIYLGAAAAALPLVVHWLTRPRPQQLPVSTLRFLREVLQQRKAAHRLRDFLVLALRTLAILLLAAALARPLWQSQSTAASSQAAHASRVVVLDISQSMAAGAHGIQHFERARARAAELLAYQSGLRANLILAGATPHPVFEQLSTNLASLHDALEQSHVEPQRLNLQAAISAAGEMLARAGAGPQEHVELVILTDMQRTGWLAPDFSALPKETEIRVESVAPAQPLANLAVLRAGLVGSPSQGKPARLEVEIGNYSPLARPVVCEASLGPAAYRLEGTCPAGGKTILSQDIPLGTAGWQIGSVRLAGADDALPADDVRAFVVDVRPTPVYALVSRQPPGAVNSSSFFLERALSPFGKRRTSDVARVVRVDPEHLDAENLAGAQLLVLDHPGKLPIEALRLLAADVRRGRSLCYLAAEAVDAVNLKQLAELCGANWRLPVEFTPPPAGNARHDLFLAEVKRGQPPFGVWGESLAGVVAPLRFSGGLASRSVDTGLNDELVASFSDRSAALVISSCGAGTVAILNFDLMRSNLASSPVFVTLVAELVERLLHDRQRGASVFCGEPATLLLPTGAGDRAGLTIEGPALTAGAPNAANAVADSAAGKLVDEGDGLQWTIAAAGPPGPYRVLRGGTPIVALAAEIPPEESDLTPLASDVLAGRLAGARTIHYRAVQSADEGIDNLWSKLAVGAVICLLLELVVLRVFRT